MIALMFLTVTWLFSEIKGVYDFALNALLTIYKFRGVSGGWAGWTIAHPVFGKIEGAAGQRQCAALLLAHPVLGTHLRP